MIFPVSLASANRSTDMYPLDITSTDPLTPWAPTPRNTQRIGSWLCARRTREHVLGAEVIVGRCWSGRGGQGQCGWRNCSQ